MLCFQARAKIVHQSVVRIFLVIITGGVKSRKPIEATPANINSTSPRKKYLNTTIACFHKNLPVRIRIFALS